MSGRKRVRPFACERLEDRTVMSGPGDWLGGLASVPAMDARKVLQAFQTFDQTYANDVRTILLPAGTTSPAANRPAFDAAIGQALTDLNAAIDSAIANLPTSTTLATTIQGELIGTGSTSLQGQLLSVPTPTRVNRGAANSFIAQSFRYVLPTTGLVANQVATAPAPAGSIDPATVSQSLKDVSTAYRTFATSYNAAVKTYLTGSGTPDRAGFDATVATALGTLNTSLATAVSTLPASVATSLQSQLQNDVLSNTTVTRNLQDTLKGLSTPTGRFSTLLFRFRSGLAISGSAAQVSQQLLSAVRTYNAGL